LKSIYLKLTVNGRPKLEGDTTPPPSLAGSKNVKCENGLRIEIVMVQ
jgi:hypothetical protein